MRCARYVGTGIVVAGALAGTQPAPAAPAGTAVIAGQIFSEWSKRDAPDRNAKGIAGLTVEVVATTWPTSEFPPFAEKPVEPLATTTTAADGTFRIEKLPAGRLGLIVRGPKIAPTLIDGFRVTEGGVYRGHEFVCNDAPRVFKSKIVRKDGGPVGGLEIFAWKTSIGTPQVFGHREVVRTKSGPDGSFTLSGTVD